MPDNTPEPYRIHDGLAVYRFGDSGDPVLLMPGPHRFQRPGMRSADALVDVLVALGRRVITFDPPGSGSSTRPASLSMREMHDCATESLDVCGVSDPVDAMGHSMGGLVSLAYTLDHPDSVKRLVLVGTGAGGPAYMDAPGALWNRSHPAFWRMALLGILHLSWPRLATERHLNNFVARHSFVDQRFVDTDAVHLRDWIRPKEGYAEWHRTARTLDYAPRLGDVSVPTLVLCGSHDPQFPPAASRQLAEGITDSRLVFFERSGHYPFVEEPDAFWTEVARFLSE